MRRALTASLRHYWRSHLAVAAGAAVAAAVLTGALLVGDSVRGSLRDLALDRLGRTDLAVVNDGYFREALAAEVSQQADIEAVPVALLPAGAVHGESGARASNVTLLGVDARFLGLYQGIEETAAWAFEGGSGAFPPVVLNQALATELGAAVGDAVLLSFTRTSDVPRASLLGRRGTGDVVQRLRLTVAAVVPSQGPGGFALTPDQAVPKNAYMPLAAVQRILGREGKVNALLIAAPGDDGSLETVDAALRQHLTVQDLGVRLLATGKDRLTVESERYVLRPETAASVHGIAEALKVPAAGYLTYLANKIVTTREGLEAVTPYSTITALDFDHLDALGALDLVAGRFPGEGEILLSAWTAEDLAAQVGDPVTLEYFVVGEGEQLLTREESFTVSGIVALSGLAVDGALTPEYEGISDADNMADWDPPFPVELRLVRPKDEEYWDQYRGAPKAFLPLAAGQALWRSRFGELTGVRLAGTDAADALRGEVATRLAADARLEPYGFAPRSVKARALAASSGATAFSGLFLGFSWFLIVAAVLLVVLLFRLGVEQRAREVGLLRAVGFPEATVRRRFLVEGGVVALVGTLVGLLGAVGYAALMMVGLRTWWVDAVGSRQLVLYVTPLSLVLGLVISLLVTVGTIWLALRRLRRVATPSLLAGSAAVTKPAARRRGGARVWWLAWGSVGVAVVLLLVMVTTGQESSSGLSFGVGALVLMAGIAFFALWCRRAGSGSGKSLLTGSFALPRMAVRNSARNPGRSLLSLTLVACACFVIVAVEAARQSFDEGSLQDKHSGAGGFALVAESDVPLFQDLGTAEGRFELGLAPEAEALLEAGATVYSLRELPGDEASCLNLFQPQKPRLLGVGAAFRERGGFHFQEVADVPGKEDPWGLLAQDLGRDPESGARILPAIGDYESAMWILKLPLGSELAMEDEAGEPIRLRIVGLLHASLFQSELLVSEENLLRHFPGREGYSFFLVESPTASAPELAAALESSLGDFGFDAGTVADRLARYSAVRNTYISTFQSLGALGLLLGTVGLAVILLRNVLERRGELAAMRAFGFRRRRLSRMVLVENAFVLLLGIGLGTGAALLAVAPYLWAGQGVVGAGLPWVSLLLTLAVIAAVGIVACAWAARRALAAHLLPALKGL